MFIFDLEGTISDHTHRHHLLPDFEAFHAEFPKDKLKQKTKLLIQACRSTGEPIFILTGMMEKHREAAEKWLLRNEVLDNITGIYMRPNDCFLPSHIFKLDAIKNHLSNFTKREVPLLVYDDRKEIIDYLLKNGIPAILAK